MCEDVRGGVGCAHESHPQTGGHVYLLAYLYCEQVKSIHASVYAGKASGIQLSAKASDQGRVAGSSSPYTNAALGLQHTVMDPSRSFRPTPLHELPCERAREG